MNMRKIIWCWHNIILFVVWCAIISKWKTKSNNEILLRWSSFVYLQFFDVNIFSIDSIGLFSDTTWMKEINTQINVFSFDGQWNILRLKIEKNQRFNNEFTLMVEIWNGVGDPCIGRMTVSYCLSKKRISVSIDIRSSYLNLPM